MYEDKNRVHSDDNQTVLIACNESDIVSISKSNMAALLSETLDVNNLQQRGILGQRKVAEGEARVRIDQKRQVKRNAKSCCYSN